MNEDGFRKVEFKEVKYEWEDYSLSFTCTCGKEEFIISEEYAPNVCDNCGRIYRLIARLEVKEPHGT